MSIGPTQRLLRRARDWAADVEELAALQWELFQLEVRAAISGLRNGALCLLAALALIGIGLPLLLVGGLVMLANAMEWPVANVLTAGGAALVVLAGLLAYLGTRFYTVESWFPRSRTQAVRNLRSVFAQMKSEDSHEIEDEYYPD